MDYRFFINILKTSKEPLKKIIEKEDGLYHIYKFVFDKKQSAAKCDTKNTPTTDERSSYIRKTPFAGITRIRLKGLGVCHSQPVTAPLFLCRHHCITVKT